MFVAPTMPFIIQAVANASAVVAVGGVRHVPTRREARLDGGHHVHPRLQQLGQAGAVLLQRRRERGRVAQIDGVGRTL